MTRARSKQGRGAGKLSSEETKYGVEFVNIHLTDDDKQAIRQVDVSDVDLFLELERLVDNGYKVSMSYDLANTGAIVSVTAQKGCSVEANSGKCITSRGPDFRGAIVCSLYKLQTYCLDGVFPLSTTRAESDFR